MSGRYELLDSGNFAKLEQVGAYKLVRPALNAAWHPIDQRLLELPGRIRSPLAGVAVGQVLQVELLRGQIILTPALACAIRHINGLHTVLEEDTH